PAAPAGAQLPPAAGDRRPGELLGEYLSCGAEGAAGALPQARLAGRPAVGAGPARPEAAAGLATLRRRVLTRTLLRSVAKREGASRQRLRGRGRVLLHRRRDQLGPLLLHRRRDGLGGVRRHLDDDLEAERVLLDAVERLVIADPQRVDRRVGRELGR